MNIFIPVGIGLFGFGLLWAAQSVALTASGEPLAWPLRYTTKKPLVRWTTRIMIHMTWLMILLSAPFALHISFVDEIRQAFPLPVPWRDIIVAFLVTSTFITAMYLFWIAAGWVLIEPQGDQMKRRGKLLRRLWSPITLAILEEAVFCGILLEQVLRAMPQSRMFSALAIVLNAALFTAVHFVKPRTEPWQRAYGFFIVGCLFGFSYVLAGRTLWVPIAVHAAAVYVVEITRLYTVFKGPRWLIGLNNVPQGGVLGSFLILFIALALAVLL